MRSLPKSAVLAIAVAMALVGVLFVAVYAMPETLGIRGSENASDTVALQATAPPTTATTTAPATAAPTRAATTAAATAAPTRATAAAAAPAGVVSPTIPYLAEWLASGHADAESEAFAHWPTATDTEVPVACAKCHSSAGYRDFLGVDGSTAGKVDKPVATGSPVDCVACHNDVAIAKTDVTFPSGVTLTNLGDETRCMECHQGRQSTVSVNAMIARAALTTTVDTVRTVSPTLSFANIHYYAAAATQYGTLVKGGYEYAGKEYEAKFEHVVGYDSCISCHNPHTLELEIEECATCHTDVSTKDDLADIRMISSPMDYDGDGNVTEGLKAEVTGLQTLLYGAIQAYVKEISPTGAIGYNSAAHPYFFNDRNDDGKIDDTEAVSANGFRGWSARLLKAAYNYQVSLKDPGAYAHNGKYMIQLLYDSIEDLNEKLTEKVDLAEAHRDDPGHFSGAGMAFRDWDDTGVVPAACVKCHTAEGLPTFIRNNGTVAVTSAGAVVTTGVGSMDPANGFLCSTCHNDPTEYTLYPVVNVPFPSGKNVTFSTEKDAKGALQPVAANLCLECHQGRASTTSVNVATTGIEDDTVSPRARFQNVHYFAAGASLFGTEAQGAYEYAGKTYLGRFQHVANFNTCTQCHNSHELEVDMDNCVTCHAGATTPQAIRITPTDFDGDEDVKEGMADEIAGLEAKLYSAIQAYSKTVTETGIVYDSHAYPYFFKDTNGNGEAEATESVSANQWTAWTPRLLRAAYNYQFVQKDPGIFAHNGKYAVQILYDSLEDLGEKAKVDLTGLTRP